MDNDNIFRRFSKSKIPDGKYKISLHFIGSERENYDLEVKSGVCTAIIPFSDLTGKRLLRRFQLRSIDIEESSDTESQFKISGTVPAALPPRLPESLPFKTLGKFSILNVGEDFGFIFNGHSFIKRNGIVEWSKFENFLIDWIVIRFGKTWLSREFHKRRIDRAPFVTMYRMFRGKFEVYTTEHDSIIAAQGVIYWFIDLAYNLFRIECACGQQPVIIDRLKSKTDQFWSTVHEVFVAAAFLRAGFSIEFENESDGSERHPEFIATYDKTGERVSVEAKALQRRQINSFQFDDWNVPNFGLGRLINDAGGKQKEIPHIVVLDINHPPMEVGEELQRLNDKMAKFIDRFHIGPSETKAEPWNCVFYTNRPFLFAEGREAKVVCSCYDVWCYSTRVAHPSEEVMQAMHDVFTGPPSTCAEIHTITGVVERSIKDHQASND